MTVDAILDEVRRCGATIYRTGAALRVRPVSAIPPELVAELRTHKSALWRLVPDYQDAYRTLTATFGTTEDLAALGWYATLNGDSILAEIAALDRRCEQFAEGGAREVAFRAAVVVLIARMHQIRTWYREAQDGDAAPAGSRPRWRLALDRNQPVQVPACLEGIEITDVGKFIAQTLTAIDYVLEQPPRSYPDGAALVRLYISQLEQVGVVAHVESVS